MGVVVVLCVGGSSGFKKINFGVKLKFFFIVPYFSFPPFLNFLDKHQPTQSISPYNSITKFKTPQKKYIPIRPTIYDNAPYTAVLAPK